MFERKKFVYVKVVPAGLQLHGAEQLRILLSGKGKHWNKNFSKEKGGVYSPCASLTAGDGRIRLLLTHEVLSSGKLIERQGEAPSWSVVPPDAAACEGSWLCSREVPLLCCVESGRRSTVTPAQGLCARLPRGKHNQKMHQSCMFDKSVQIEAGFCPGKLQIWFVITHWLCSHGKLPLMPAAGFWSSVKAFC